jgi:hypothetical protein
MKHLILTFLWNDSKIWICCKNCRNTLQHDDWSLDNILGIVYYHRYLIDSSECNLNPLINVLALLNWYLDSWCILILTYCYNSISVVLLEVLADHRDIKVVQVITLCSLTLFVKVADFPGTLIDLLVCQDFRVGWICKILVVGLIWHWRQNFQTFSAIFKV